MPGKARIAVGFLLVLLGLAAIFGAAIGYTIAILSGPVLLTFVGLFLVVFGYGLTIDGFMMMVGAERRRVRAAEDRVRSKEDYLSGVEHTIAGEHPGSGRT